MSAKRDRIEEILARYDAALAGAEGRVIDAIAESLDNAYQRLEGRLIRAYQKHAEDRALLPRQRALLILEEVSTYLELLNPKARAAIEENFEGLLRGAYESGLNLSDELSRAIADERLADFAAVPLEAVRYQAQESAARLYRWSGEMQSKISRLAEAHIALGDGPAKLATSLRRELGIVKGRAEAIARTETLSSFNLAAQANYARNGIEYVQIIATADDRTCPICLARNGNAYRLGEISAPLHVRCRCYLMPWRPEWQRAGLIQDDWFVKFRAEAIAAGAGELDNGPAPFERSAGLPRPRPVWQPGAA